MIHPVIIFTIALLECEFSGSYLTGYAEGRKMGSASLSKAKENCLQGTLKFMEINHPKTHR